MVALDFVRALLDQDADQWLVIVKGSQNTIFLEDVVAGLVKNPLDTARIARQSPQRQTKKQRFYQQATQTLHH